MKNMTRILWGVVLILLGVVFGLNALGIASINLFFDGWWTIFIIVPCMVGLFTDNDKTGSIIGLFIGVFLLLGCQNIISFKNIWKLVLPIILVVIGLSMLFKDALNIKVKKEISKISKGKSDKSYCSTFGTQKINFDGEELVECDLEAIFGGIELDLRESIIKKDVVINANTVFGGITITLPKDVKVKVSSTPIFGGVDNKYINSKNDKAKTIYINASCIFGGVDIK